jgi:hypothetical protein
MVRPHLVTNILVKKFGTLSMFFYKKGVERKIGNEDILVMLNHKLRRKKNMTKETQKAQT